MVRSHRQNSVPAGAVDRAVFQAMPRMILRETVYETPSGEVVMLKHEHNVRDKAPAGWVRIGALYSEDKRYCTSRRKSPSSYSR
jgi:hypothetical protein